MDNQDKPILVFVYNADSGLFNTLTDIAHKVFSPTTYQCHLCELSHGYFSMRDEWADFIRGLELEGEYLHRDEFHQRYGDLVEDFPAILLHRDGPPEPIIDAQTINACQSIDQLKKLISSRCACELS